MLVARARQGDQDAWSGLVARYARLVYSIARRHGLDQELAADVSQVTWLRLAENLHRIEHPERLVGWLSTTARNESLRVANRRGREVASAGVDLVAAADADAEPQPGLDEPLLRDERARALWLVIEQLPPQCQLLLRLLVAQPDISYREITEILGIPHGSIGPTRARCLARARALLEASHA